MATARSLPRRTPVASAARTAARPTTSSSGYRGSAGLEAMRREEERAVAMAEVRKQTTGSPFRFYCPVGESRELIVVDERPDFFRHEHNLKNQRSGKYDIYCACIAEHANCPPCSATDRPAYFAMLLTVIDLTPYVNRDGVEIPWSKKILCVKQMQQKKFMRLLDRAEAQGQTLRGMVVRMVRDSEKEAAIGDPEWDGEWVTEEDLLTYEDQYTDQHGKVHDIIGHEVFDYDTIFPMPTEQMLRAIVGGKAGAGTTEGDNEAIGRTAQGRRTAPRDDWEGSQAGGRGAAPAVRRPARGAPAQQLDPDDNPETGAEPEAEAEEYVEEEAAPPPGPSRRAPVAQRSAVAPRPVSSRAAPARAPVEQPPARGSSMAARRAALRR